MDEFFRWLSSNPVATTTVIVAFGAVVIAMTLMFFIAFIRGQEISFWPPKITRLDRTQAEAKAKENSLPSETRTIQIEFPKDGATVHDSFEMFGSCKLSGDDTVQVFTVWCKNPSDKNTCMYWPHSSAEIEIDRRRNTWHAKLYCDRIGFKVGENKSIMVAIVGKAGQALSEFYWKVTNRFQDWPGIVTLTPDIDVETSPTITLRRE